MKSCSFIGYSSFASKNDPAVVNNLRILLAILAENGVTDFYADGSCGWGMCCEYSVHLLKKDHPQTKLHLVLPCPPEQQTSNWSEELKITYDVLVENADSVEVVSENNNENCMSECNMRLAEYGDICVCYYDKNDSESDTAKAVRAAGESKKIILNMCFDPEKKNIL